MLRRIFFCFFAVICIAPSVQAEDGKVYSYVANTSPPDAFLALKLYPTSSSPRIMAMANGTKLEVLLRRTDGWWYVRIFPTNEEGWAYSGRGSKAYILCCSTAEGDVAADEVPALELTKFTCDQLWFGRNSVFKEAGYCFKTPRAISVFGNAGCQFDDIKDIRLTQENENFVNAIQFAEKAKACPK